MGGGFDYAPVEAIILGQVVAALSCCSTTADHRESSAKQLAGNVGSMVAVMRLVRWRR